jgi:hypothetical protein
MAATDSYPTPGYPAPGYPAPAYPVRVDASLDSPLSRWLWLVKWLLVIPHYIVLAFLWLAFVVLSAAAFVAILFTGRYPRDIFDFNVGVLRWTWRVQYYAIGAFGTDRYPPFTLADDPSYPAHLEIAYPDRLSRGLVLVKWWLLAIPQYFIVGIFTGGGLWLTWQLGSHNSSWPGLIGILAVVAAVVLAVTGRYPQQLFDLLLGLNRWVLRVAAYAGLMTDKYPPFRLDMGGQDPASTLTWPPPVPTSQAPRDQIPPPVQGSVPAPGRAGWTAGRIVGLIAGIALALCSLGLLVGGGAAWWADSLRHGGYVDLGTASYRTSGYAVASPTFVLPATGGWAPFGSFVGTVRIRATAPAGAAPVFIGIAPADAASGYLSGVAHETVSDFTGAQGVSTEYGGVAPSVPPTMENFWAVRASGPGTQVVVWPVRSGNWMVVAMNADRSPQVSVRVNVAATLPDLPGIAVGLLIGGCIALALGTALIVVSVHGASRRAATSQRQA